MVFDTEVASNIDDNKAQFAIEDLTFWGIHASGMHTCRTILKKNTNNHINKWSQKPFVFTSLNKAVFLQKTTLKTEKIDLYELIMHKYTTFTQCKNAKELGII